MRTLVTAALSWLALVLLIGIVEMLGQHAVSSGLLHLRTLAARRRLDRRREAMLSGRVERGLVAFYSSTPLGAALVTLEGDHPRRTIPLYSPPGWLVHGEPAPLATLPLIRSTGNLRDLPRQTPKPKALRRKESLFGTEYWDGDTLLTTELPTDYGGSVSATCTGYFEVGEQVAILEEQAIRHALHRWRGLSAHRRAARGFSSAARGIGGLAVFAIDSAAGDPEVLIHHRSDHVGTNPGMWCATPTYLLEDPRANGRRPSVLGLELYNLIREVLEEAYGYPELNRSTHRPDTDWFLSLPEGAGLVAGLADGSVRALHLGWYVNLTNGLLDAMSLLHVTGDADLCRRMRDGVNASRTEVANIEGSIRWVPLFSPDLTREMRQPRFHGGSALAIQTARAVLCPSPTTPA